MSQLERVRDLLSDPVRWTKGAFARDKNGTPVPVNPDGPAVAWCALGACLHVNDRYRSDGASSHLHATIPPSSYSIADYNDSLPDHGALMTWLDRAVEHEAKG
jgi:hypothetical protein